MLYLIRFSEISLKGKNRNTFTRQLAKNISLKLKNIPHKINITHSQLTLETPQHDHSITTKINNTLETTFGVSWFAQVVACPTNINKLTQVSLQIISKHTFKTFALRVNRSDKTLAFTSQDIAIKIGQIIKDETKTQVNLDNPDLTLYIDLQSNTSYLYTQKTQGLDGLPIGSSGKLLCLFSGGFDSSLATYMLAQRGAQIDYLHFHVFPDPEKIKTTKIPKIINKLYPFTLSKNLFLAPYTPFQLQLLNQNRYPNQELIVFRRLMLKIALILAQKHHYQAIILGDSLGQVASQTIDNLQAVEKINTPNPLPIFRPLIGTNKQEIINRLQQIHLYNILKQPYKDCCSIVATQATTKANLDKLTIIEKQINTDQIIQEILSQTTLISI